MRQPLRLTAVSNRAAQRKMLRTFRRSFVIPRQRLPFVRKDDWRDRGTSGVAFASWQTYSAPSIAATNFSWLVIPTKVFSSLPSRENTSVVGRPNTLKYCWLARSLPIQIG